VNAVASMAEGLLKQSVLTLAEVAAFALVLVWLAAAIRPALRWLVAHWGQWRTLRVLVLRPGERLYTRAEVEHFMSRSWIEGYATGVRYPARERARRRRKLKADGAEGGVR
jgi:hypothetical protein